MNALPFDGQLILAMLLVFLAMASMVWKAWHLIGILRQTRHRGCGPCGCAKGPVELSSAEPDDRSVDRKTNANVSREF